MLRLSTLGQIDLRTADGKVVRSLLSQPKAMALLVYLVLARPRGYQRRDTLCALFWPESDDEHARGALSQTLSRIRRSLGRRAIETRGHGEVRVATGQVDCDVVAFEEAVAVGESGAALSHYQGPFLQGFQVHDAPGFERWTDAERDRLRRSAVEVAWDHAHRCLLSGEPLEAEGAAQRALALAPALEQQVRGFMEALARAGDRGAALRFYQKLVETLATELEVEPAEETTALAAAIREGAVGPEKPAGTALPSPGAGAQVPSGSAAQTGVRAGATRGAPRTLPARGNDPTSPPGRGDSTSPPTRKARRRGWTVAALVMMGLLAIGYGMVGEGTGSGPGTLFGTGRVEKYPQVVVADFTALFDPAVGRIAADCLQIALSQSDVVRPVAPAAVGSALQRMRRDPSLTLDEETAHEIAVRDGYPLVVVARMEDVGTGYLISARLEAAGSREVLGRFSSAAGSLEDLLPALDRLGAEIRERIGDSRRSIRETPPLAQVTTHSMEALTLYTDGVRLAGMGGRAPEAIRLFEQAIRLDPAFAMAYGALGRTLNSYLTQPLRQAELSEKAYEHRDRLPDFERLIVESSYLFNRATFGADSTASHLDVCGIFEPQARLYEDYARTHPQDPRPLIKLGFYLDRTGRFQEAEEVYRRGLEMAPTVELYRNLVTSHLQQGEREEALRVQREWRERFGESHWWLLSIASDAARRRDYTTEDSVYTAYEAAYAADPGLRLAQGRVDAVRGRMTETWDHYRDAISAMEREGDSVVAAVWGSDLALIRLIAIGDSAEVTRGMDEAIGRIPSGQDLAGGWIDVGLLYALTGDAEGARWALDTLAATAKDNWSPELRAAIALADDDPVEAVRILQFSESACEFNPAADHRADHRWRRILAGRAYEATGDGDGAVSAYEAYFTDPPRAPPTTLDAIFLFDTLERLGRLHEARGDRGEAAGYYRRAADLWKEADLELQPRVQSLKERAARLR